MLADLRHILKVSFTHVRLSAIQVKGILNNLSFITSERDSKQHILHLDQGLDCSTVINQVKARGLATLGSSNTSLCAAIPPCGHNSQ